MSHEYDSTYINDELEDPDATINDTNANGNNLAMRALIEDGRLSSNDLKALIEAGLDVNHQNNKGQTLLMLMSDYFVDDVDDRELEYIVQKGADIGLRDNEGKTALDYTIENRIDNIGKAITLIELGASTGDRLVLFKVFDAMEEDYGKEHDNAIEMYGKIITGLLSIGADPTLKKPKTQEFDEISIFGRFLNVVRDFEDHPLKEAISEILTPLINAVKEDASELVLDDLMTNALFHAFRGGHGNLILADTFIKAGGNPTDLYIEDEEDVGPDKVAFLKKQKASYKRKQTRTTAASSTAVPPRVIEDLSELLTQTLRRAANASENDRSELYEEAKSLVREGAKMPTAEQVFHGTIPTVDALRRVVNFIGSQPAAPAAAAQSSGCPPCPAILKSGKNKGKVCGAPGRYGGYCGVHKQAQQ